MFGKQLTAMSEFKRITGPEPDEDRELAKEPEIVAIADVRLHTHRCAPITRRSMHGLARAACPVAIASASRRHRSAICADVGGIGYAGCEREVLLAGTNTQGEEDQVAPVGSRDQGQRQEGCVGQEAHRGAQGGGEAGSAVR